MLGHVFRRVIAEPRGFGGAGAGDDAHDHAYDRGKQDWAGHPPALLLGNQAVVLHFFRVKVQPPHLFRLCENLNQCEQAD